MQFVVERNKLFDGLNIVSKAVTTRSTLEVLSCVMLEVLQEGIRLTATDMELGIKTTVIPAEVQKTGEGLFEGRLLIDIIKKLSGSEVSVSQDKDVAEIKCGKSKYTLKVRATTDFPKIKEVEKEKSIVVSQGELKQAIRQTIFSVSLNESKPVLTGELFHITGSQLHIVSVDGYRISYRNLDIKTEQPETKIMIPAKSLSEVQKLLAPDEEKELSLYFTDYHALFEMEECTVVTRLLEGQFIAYQQMLEIESNIQVKVNIQEMLTGIDRAALITMGKEKKPVTMEVLENSITVTSDSEIGSSYEEIKTIETEGKTGLKIGFNPKYLLDILSAIDNETAILHLSSELSPLVVLPEGNQKDFKYLVLPLRLPKGK